MKFDRYDLIGSGIGLAFLLGPSALSGVITLGYRQKKRSNPERRTRRVFLTGAAILYALEIGGFALVDVIEQESRVPH